MVPFWAWASLFLRDGACGGPAPSLVSFDIAEAGLRFPGPRSPAGRPLADLPPRQPAGGVSFLPGRMGAGLGCTSVQKAIVRLRPIANG